jgi:hypothetical protein
MLFQSHAIFADNRPVTCKLLDNSESLWEVEYSNNGTITTTKVDPKELISLDYCQGEISQ